MDIFVNQEFRGLIPPLQPDEYQELERSLISEGNRVPIDIWKGYIVDGHNRYDICQRQGIALKPPNSLTLVDREDVKVWIIRNQFGRRNINNYQRCELVLKLKDIISTKAKGNQKQHGGTAPGKSLSLKSDEVNTNKELAKIAHVSHDTIAKLLAGDTATIAKWDTPLTGQERIDRNNAIFERWVAGKTAMELANISHLDRRFIDRMIKDGCSARFEQLSHTEQPPIYNVWNYGSCDPRCFLFGEGKGKLVGRGLPIRKIAMQLNLSHGATQRAVKRLQQPLPIKD